LGDVLTLTEPRSDDPLLGVTVPVASSVNPDEERPSHLQEVHAELVARLPVPDEQGGTHHEMPPLETNADYKAYIRSRTAAWQASRGKNSSPLHG
jgi:phospholipase C